MVLSGSEELALYNLKKRDKAKRIRGKMTAGKVSLDGSTLVYAEGNDWCTGIS